MKAWEKGLQDTYEADKLGRENERLREKIAFMGESMRMSIGQGRRVCRIWWWRGFIYGVTAATITLLAFCWIIWP